MFKWLLGLAQSPTPADQKNRETQSYIKNAFFFFFFFFLYVCFKNLPPHHTAPSDPNVALLTLTRSLALTIKGFPSFISPMSKVRSFGADLVTMTNGNLLKSGAHI